MKPADVRFVGGAWAAGSLLFFFDKHNGLSMSPSAIGTASALNGLWTVVAQLTLLNRIRRWLGISRAYKTLTFGWILVWLLLPNLRTLMELTETPLPQQHTYDPILYPPVRGWLTSIGVNLMLSFVTLVGLSNSLLMVLINFSSPDRTALGAVNGISTAVGVSHQHDNALITVYGPSPRSFQHWRFIRRVDGWQGVGWPAVVDLYGHHVHRQLWNQPFCDVGPCTAGGTRCTSNSLRAWAYEVTCDPTSYKDCCIAHDRLQDFFRQNVPSSRWLRC